MGIPDKIVAGLCEELDNICKQKEHTFTIELSISTLIDEGIDPCALDSWDSHLDELRRVLPLQTEKAIKIHKAKMDAFELKIDKLANKYNTTSDDIWEVVF